MATPLANQIPLTGDPLKDRLIQGSAWTFSGARVLTYSLNINFDLDEQGTPMPGVGGNWTGSLSAAFVKALTAWSNVANVGFQAFPSGNYIFESQADIAAALTGNDLQNGFGAAGRIGSRAARKATFSPAPTAPIP